MTRIAVLVALIVAVLTCGCNLLDPERPTPQPDTTVFGNVLEVMEPGDEGIWLVRVKVGIPRALTKAEEAEGRQPPAIEKGLIAEVSVTADTVVVLGGAPAELEAFNPGSEVMIEPVIGTTRMLGSSQIRCEAAMLMDFVTYATWRLPELPEGLIEVTHEERADASLINSDANEVAPVVPGNGEVLYFSSSLRRSAVDGSVPVGALRQGLVDEEDSLRAKERTYRTELGAEGWTAPELVRFDGLGDPDGIRVTWVSSDERACLVTVIREGEPIWFGKSTRPRPRGSWSAPEEIVQLSSEGGSDAVYLTGSTMQIAFVSQLFEGGTTDVFLFSPKLGEEARPLDPRVSTPAAEWAPRTGPGNELFFMRGDRQMVLAGDNPLEIRLQGTHRALFSQAAPSADGRWVFICVPRFAPGTMDQDIAVAPWLEPGLLGEPVAIDDWRPLED